MEWINIKDREPPEDEEVLIYTGNYFLVGQFLYRENGKPIFIGGDGVSECTHWMPLPSKPKDEK